MIYAKIHKKTSDAGDSDSSQRWVTLKPKWGYRVQCAEGHAEGIEPENESGKAKSDNCESSEGTGNDDSPCKTDGHLACCKGKERLVDFVNADVVDLVDTDNEGIAQKQGSHTQHSSW